MNRPAPLELLAPARTAEIAMEAIKHGADAVYIGAPSHGARSAATNTIDDIRRVCDFAHPFGARIYVTVNTIVYEPELADVEKMIHQLYRAGVDALIVQDLGILRLDLPPIALHASTQCDIRTPEKARFLAEAGFSQLVLPRELTLEETAEIHRAVPDTPLEAFVHGALCVSYSGDCQAGQAMCGRSANRGECPQVCRMAFNLIDGKGRTVLGNKHLLSLRDLNRSALLAQMAEAGVQSFKIEGRLKDMDYVKNVTAAYRALLDTLIEAEPQRWCRSSYGHSEISFKPILEKSFNRGFTTYFTTAARPETKMASFGSPKWCGEKIGRIVNARGTRVKVDTDVPLANGDGLGFFNAQGTFTGFRVNRVEGRTIIAARPVEAAPGTELYRNHDKLRLDMLGGETAVRTIPLRLTLRPLPYGIALDGTDTRGCTATVTADGDFQPATSPQTARRREALGKTGGTIYKMEALDDRCGDMFIPASLLSRLRRTLIESLDSAWRCIRPVDLRRSEKKDFAPFKSSPLTYHDNVANSRARDFYKSHGMQVAEGAMECGKSMRTDGERCVMTTRYCLRRELGACLRTPQGSSLRGPLHIENGSARFRLDFNCKECRMHVMHCPPKPNGFSH